MVYLAVLFIEEQIYHFIRIELSSMGTKHKLAHKLFYDFIIRLNGVNGCNENNTTFLKATFIESG